MDKIRWGKPLWFLLHAIAVAAVFWLGHAINFPELPVK